MLMITYRFFFTDHAFTTTLILDFLKNNTRKNIG